MAIGPGHASIFPFDGANWMTVHFYDGASEDGTSMLGIAEVVWGEDSWPVAIALP